MEQRILFTIMLTSFLTPFTGSALNLALPSLGAEYGASPAQLGWVLGSFLLAAIVVLLPFGKLADRYGKRYFFIMGKLVLNCFKCSEDSGITTSKIPFSLFNFVPPHIIKSFS